MKITVQCPHCQSRYEIDERYGGRIARCIQCQNKFPIPAADTGDTYPSKPALELKTDDLWPEVPDQASLPAPPRTPPAAPPSYQAHPVEAVESEDIPDPGPLFRKDLLRLTPPFRTKGEASTFTCILLLLAVWPLLEELNLFCCLMFFIRAAILGCLCTFFFSIVQETARGHDDLPYPGSIRGALENFWTEIIVPLINFIASFIYISLPALAANIIEQIFTKGNFDPNATPSLPVYVIMITGLFFWPMVMLILAYDQLPLLLRPDLILKSIRAVIRPYLICWLCLLVGFAIMYAASQFFALLSQPEFIVDPVMIVAVILLAVDLSVFIYAMRVIGLLYRHYHHLFYWQLEKPKKHPLED